MLEIKLSTGKLNLSDDIQINLIIENPLLNFEKIPVPYTLSFDVPGTPTNLKMTGFPNRVTSFKKMDLPGEVLFDGVSFLKGLITVLGFNKTIRLSFKGVDIFDALLQKMYTANLPEYDLGEVAYGGSPGQPPKAILDRTFPGNIAYNYKTLFSNASTHTGGLPFFVAPVKIAGAAWQNYFQRIDYPFGLTGTINIEIDSNLPATSADEQYLNFYNPAGADFNLTNNYKYNRPGRFNPNMYVLSTITPNTRAFPFPYIQVLMNAFFAGTLVNNPFTEDADLAKLCLITAYHPNWVSAAGNYVEEQKMQGMLFKEYHPVGSTNRYVIKLADYLPDLGMNELLRGLMKMFCLSLFPVFGQYKLVKNEEIMASNVVENWQSKLIDKLSIELNLGQQYKYGYDIDDESTDIIETIEVLTITEMINYTLTADMDYAGNFKITSTGEVYRKEMVDAEFEYTRLNSGFGKAEDLQGEAFDVVTNLTPLPMSVSPYWHSLGPENKVPAKSYWYCPEYSGSRTDRPTNAHVMFDRGMVATPTGGHTYPLLTATNVGPSGQVLGEKSLAWEGENGLLNKYHNQFKNWIEKDKVKASGTFKLSATDLKGIDMAKKKSIDGKRFYIEKLQVTLTKTQIKPAVVDLIEA